MTDDTAAEDQIQATALRMVELCMGEPAWLILAAHVACLMHVACEMPRVRAEYASALRNAATVLDALGDARGPAALEIVRAHALLFDAVDSGPRQ